MFQSLALNLTRLVARQTCALLARQLSVRLLNRRNALDLRTGAFSFELGLKKDFDNALGQLGTDHPCTDGQDLRVVAFACALGGIRVMGLRGTDAFDLVRGNSHADAGTANQHTQTMLPRTDSGRHRLRDIRVKHRTGRVAAKVLKPVTQCFDM
ncbi:hypothetical protein FQZ97_1015460 [compost metagenome]